MSSYVKLHLVVADFAVGYQSVNQAIDNNQALYDQLNAGHSTGIRGGAYGDPFLQPGQHDDPLVARTVLQVGVNTAVTPPTASAVTTGPMLYGQPIRMDTGYWRIKVTTPQLVGAVATCRATGTVDRYATCRVVMDASGPYVDVSTWNIAAAAKVDCDFDVVLWAESVA